MRTAAVLPVKSFIRAKQRLATAVPAPIRAQLARAMVEDVLLALGEIEAIERIIVVTREQSVVTVARERGAQVVEDRGENGQSAAVALGLERALAEGFERVICVPGDCPSIDPEELGALLRASTDRPEVVIMPDRHGTGTNGLLLTPPDAIAPSFGPDSFSRHRALARDAGVACRVERPASLLLDIDTGADLAALRERLSGAHARARRTRSVLGQPERTIVLPITGTG
jgi:2-phospho-L-lactate/phosphoenolpyruvate guanylyltransferase